MITYVGSDNVVRLGGGRTTVLATGLSTYLDDTAVVTFRVQTLAHVDVPGESWPVPMTYVAGSQGEFLGVLRDTVALVPDTDYRLIGVADNGSDQRRTWDIPLRALMDQS